MAVGCLKCGYTMETKGEIMATVAHVASGILVPLPATPKVLQVLL